MLNERIRNSIVGLTMLVALGAFMVGVFVLGRFPTWGQVQAYTITIDTPNAAGLAPGNKVDFNGVQIGSVGNTVLAPAKDHVSVTLSINAGVDIPNNSVAQIAKQTIGPPTVSLSLPPDPAHPDRTLPPAAPLPHDGTGRLAASAADSGLIPRAVIDQLTQVGTDLHELLQKRSLAEFEATAPDKRTANISILVQRLDRLARGFDALIGDPQTQEKFHKIVDNIEAASSQLKSTLASVDTTVNKANNAIDEFGTAGKNISAAATQAGTLMTSTQKQIEKTAEQLADLLASIQKTTDALAKGQGTAGRLVQDPRLYDGLLDLTTSLKNTSDELNVLIRKWKEEGLRLNLK